MTLSPVPAASTDPSEWAAPATFRDETGAPTSIITERHYGDPRLSYPPCGVEPRAPERGRQYPRRAVLPAWDTTQGDDAIDLAAIFGIEPLPWQAIVLRNSLAEDGAGRWAAFELALIVPRQNGKNVSITARQLYGLFVLGERQIFTAHLFKTAVEAHDDLVDALDRVPELREQVAVTKSASNRSVYLKDNPRARVDFLSRGKASGRGLSADVVYLDEAFQLSESLVGDLLPVLSSRRRPQVWYTSSAGMEGSDVLEKLRTRAHETPEEEARLAYLEWAYEPGVDDAEWDTLEAAAASNPSLGYFQTWEWIKSVDLRNLSEDTYKRERLGVWADKLAGAVIGPEVWARARTDADALAGVAVLKRAMAVEVTRDRDLAVIAGAAELEDGRILVEIIEQRAGTGWLAEACRSISAKGKGHDFEAGVVVDGLSAASAVVPHIIAEGTPCSLANTRDLVEGTAEVFDRLTHRTASGIPDPLLLHPGTSTFLDDAAATARRRLVGQSRTAWTWAEGPAAMTLAPLRAITLAVRGLTMPPAEGGRRTRRGVA